MNVAFKLRMFECFNNSFTSFKDVKTNTLLKLFKTNDTKMKWAIVHFFLTHYSIHYALVIFAVFNAKIMPDFMTHDLSTSVKHQVF